MATIFSHPAVPLAIGAAAGRTVIPLRLLWAGVICSIIPDLDVIAFGFGIPYGHYFGHRGFTHSVVFAGLAGFLALASYRWWGCSKKTAFFFVFASTLSHGVLDALSTGGLGIAFFWPYVGRYFLPWQFIDVSPIGFSFFSPWGLAVLRAELLWIWLPALVIAACGFFGRRIYARAKSPGQSHVHLCTSQSSGHTGPQR
jgi:inner membrane protein